MYNKNNKKSAMVTTELVIGIGLSVAVVFIAIGLFKNNLKTMVSNASLSNGFMQNESKTDYDSYNRDYTDSQINVQIMGEQGLAMFRKKANNLSLELISSQFNDTNTNADTVEYLSLAIEAIVGKGSICTYMKKESDKFCTEDELGGYQYLVSSSGGSTITIQKTDTLADYSIGLSLNGALTGFINSLTIPKDEEGRSAFTTEEKYAFIKKLTSAFKPHILSNAILVNDIADFKSSPVTSPQALAVELSTLVVKTKNIVDTANDKCHNPLGTRKLTKECRNGYVDNQDQDDFKNWSKEFESELNALVQDEDVSKSAIASLIKNKLAENNRKSVEVMSYDHVNKPRACQVFIENLVKISKKYNLEISDLDIDETNSYYSIPSKKYECRAYK
jgi:hypothetical protein